MKTDTEKKMAAAMAAVAAYMQREEESAQAAAAAAMAQLEPPAAPEINHWGLSGRQSMMQLRNLMQMKAFHRF
jgi:hypothetical protein